jgi:pyruvate/2-oxoacid:ferredoxin oxidoreductase beta subunit
MAYGNVYVARVAWAPTRSRLQAFLEAEAYDGHR